MIPFSDEELLEPVKHSIEKVRPMLVRDNGDITLIKIQDAKVYVRLEGACKGCAASSATLKLGVERQIRHDIHPEIEVIEITQKG
ncbi:NifU family protein [Helicobacter fennelliae]|uniref:Iron-sulfur cluster assembly scaffold protein NifU n=2 Tax=Helicobacter fennelliae TaxID=215 RepID=T1CMG0_9HELI|nr:NifU family protein [Helicobacter fennelliae]GAD17924.1 iron-sulfur cluster assembly scaffold protein NifU [Helicobacter fennelliae MRY12-0050]SQB99371.1 nifU protein-like protein [Helicobacter fennelliae]STP07649.1 nifU protein-like protein [Helicobacter fennelliae]STQ84934.1 nifU protein-like protein [Helicobacter fennelliae]